MDFLERHRNLLVSVTYSGRFNPKGRAVSFVGWYYSNASYFFNVAPRSFCPYPPECDCPSALVSAPVRHLSRTHYQRIMADVMDVRIGQRMMMDFLTVEGSSPIEIQRRLRSVFSEDAIDVRSVRRCIRRKP